MKYYPGIVGALKNISSYLVEINSNDIEESKKNNKLVHVYNKFTRGILLHNSSAFVSVSNELINDNIFKKYEKPSIVIANGYNFNNTQNHKKKFNKKIKFVFIGTPNQDWNGIDKVIAMASILNDSEFHVIGTKIEELELLYDIKLSKNIYTYGYLSQEESMNIILKCDIGISTLALHRKNMNEASPLKSRQYLSLGLPIITAYIDTDFKSEQNFILNIGNYEDNVANSIDEIKKLMDKISLLIPNEIINESKKYLDYKEKEKKRINFLSLIAGRNND